MAGGEKKQIQDVDVGFGSVALKHPEIFTAWKKGARLARTQATRYPNPMFYNKNSDSRFGDLKKELGVCYVATSNEVAIAETFQHGSGGPGTPVLISDIQRMSVHQFATARRLRLVDVAKASAFMGYKLRDLVEAQGQGSEGYLLPQTLSAAIMRHGEDIDGLLYTSQVFPSASNDSCIVLFERKKPQLVLVSSGPLVELELTNGQTAVEFLRDLKVTVE